MKRLKLLTPKDLAEAIGVSESSLRRWVDSGDIRMSRTAGGHRRIPVAEAVQFARRIGVPIVRPDLLGLDVAQAAAAPGESDDEKLFEILRSGDRQLARSVILSWYLSGQSLTAIFDGPMRHAMHQLGELWKHEGRGILIEHRATEICMESIAMLRDLLPTAEEEAPLAIGGAPEDDPYLLPTMMAAAVLGEAGFRDANFGGRTPVDLLAHEAVRRGAKLVWLSVSAPQDFEHLRATIARAAEMLAPHQIQVVIGGRHNAECTPRGLPNVSDVGSMAELAAFAASIKAG